jgi:hypothetical protein
MSHRFGAAGDVGCCVCKEYIGIGLFHCYQNLLFDFLPEHVITFGNKTSSVDDIEIFSIPVCDAVLSVARDTAHIIYNGLALFKQSVKQGAFPNVRSSCNGYCKSGHETKKLKI